MSSLVRRLAAVFTLLSVLLGTLGRAHPSCGLGVGDGGSLATATTTAHAVGAHHPGSGGEPDDHCSGNPAGTSSRMPPPGHDGSPGAGCAWVAHCVTWTPTASVLTVASSLPPGGAMHAVHETMIPLGPDAEPEFPPPRA